MPLRVPVAFRATSREPWTLAWTVNVSRSGLLLECEPDTAVPPHYLEFVMGLAPGVPGTHNVVCRGRVVRVEHAAVANRIAVTIDDFECGSAR